MICGVLFPLDIHFHFSYNKTMKIQLSDHFNYSKLIRFTLPSIASMIFISIYGVVDGIFVSNFVGKTPFAAINLIYPAMMLVIVLCQARTDNTIRQCFVIDFIQRPLF